MKKRTQNSLALFGWVTLIQTLSVLVSAGMVILTFDPFGGDGGMTVFGVLFLFGWAVWGYFLPRKVSVSGFQMFAVLGVWSGLLLALWFRLEEHMILFHFPQMLTGLWLVQLWPGDPSNAWYQQTLRPVMVQAAHVLLPAMMALGIWLRDREEAAGNERK